MKNKVFIIIGLSFFVFFTILLLAESQGYYKNRNEKAKTLTEEQIKEFENDLKEGKDINIKKYILYEDKDYSNNLTNKVYEISLKLEDVVNNTIKIIFNSTEKIVND